MVRSWLLGIGLAFTFFGCHQAFAESPCHRRLLDISTNRLRIEVQKALEVKGEVKLRLQLYFEQEPGNPQKYPYLWLLRAFKEKGIKLLSLKASTQLVDDQIHFYADVVGSATAIAELAGLHRAEIVGAEPPPARPERGLVEVPQTFSMNELDPMNPFSDLYINWAGFAEGVRAQIAKGEPEGSSVKTSDKPTSTKKGSGKPSMQTHLDMGY